MKISLRHELNQLDNLMLKPLCLVCKSQLAVMEYKGRIEIISKYSLKMVQKMWIIIANNYWAFITWRCCATRCIIITCNVLFLLKINKETHHGHQLHSLNHCWAHGCGQKVVKGLCCTSGNHDDCLYQFSREMKQCKRYKPLLTLCPWASHVVQW